MRILILLFTLAFAHSTAFCSDINVSELLGKMPLGIFGSPLGTRLIITGAYPKRAIMASNPLEVAEVDGKRPSTPLTIEIRGKVQIREGVTYRLEGYEAGEFSGDPGWFNPQVQQPLQYHVFLVVTKVIEPATK